MCSYPQIIIQKFFLATDKSTIAVEVLVFLTSEETRKILKHEGGLLGHIDFLQYMNGKITILDYKPEASKEKNVIDQLLLYAIALSARTKIHLKNINCAWFDEKNYYKFKALDAYYKFRNKMKEKDTSPLKI